MLQLKKKVSQNRTKLQQTTNNNKQQQQTTIFSAKNKLSIFETNFTKFEGKVRFGQIFFLNDPLDEPNQMPSSKKFYLLSKLVKNAKWWSKSNLPLSYSTAKFFPLKRNLKNTNNIVVKCRFKRIEGRDLNSSILILPILWRYYI